jgi:N-glycosylase/DNA lyase
MVTAHPRRRRSHAPVGSAAILQAKAPYQLLRTLSCGQAFGWRADGGRAGGVFAGRRVELEQRGEQIVVAGLDDDIALRRLRHYLQVDAPLAEIELALRRDRVLRTVVPRTSGIAILRQDPWECLISFIVSAFNNIPKIERTLAALTARFGEKAPGGVRRFPSPDALASAPPAALRECVLGYRAPYVRAAARLVARGGFDLDAPGFASYDQARAMLLELPGVGEKVVDCVLLFAYGKGEAFPVDVWVKRAVERSYFSGRPRSEREIRAFARQRFGPLAGYAQQHLFYYYRSLGGPAARGLTAAGARRRTARSPRSR